MNRVMMLAAVALLAGCQRDPIPQPSGPDQQLRREIFMECLSKAPAGPQITKYNDWAEVIEECGDAAYYQSLQIGPNPGHARAANPTPEVQK